MHRSSLILGIVQPRVLLQTPPDSTTMTQVIDPNGDVALLLTADLVPVRLIVSSKILSLASPVFAAMFSPHFREGRSLSSTCLTEIPLPDDPPTAIRTIANILHFRHNLVFAVGFDCIFNLALVADKYDLVHALGPWRQIWLDCLSSPDDVIDGCLGRNIFIRYVFGDRVGFECLTKQAILRGDGIWTGNDFEMLSDRITGISYRVIMWREFVGRLTPHIQEQYHTPASARLTL